MTQDERRELHDAARTMMDIALANDLSAEDLMGALIDAADRVAGDEGVRTLGDAAEHVVNHVREFVS